MVFQLATLAVDDVFPNRDPLYMVWVGKNLTEVWNWMMIHPAETVITMALLCAVLLFWRNIYSFLVASSAWVGTLPGIRHIRKWLGDKAMRKEQLEEQSAEWVDEIIEVTESKVAGELWTRTQAKEWYAKFSRHFPILRYAATHDDTAGDLKAAIQERRLNEHRDVNGAVIPVPVP